MTVEHEATSGPTRLALTFEDGPDHLSTPRFLRLLDRYDVRATFFVLGVQLVRDRGLVRDMAAAGHELAVHGWDHRPLLLRGASVTYDEIARTRDLAERIGGTPVRRFRPPGGLLTRAARRSCRRLGLVPVSPDRLSRPGSTGPQARTLHLRDADHDAASIGSWRPSLRALATLLDACREREVVVGPLREVRPLGPAPARVAR